MRIARWSAGILLVGLCLGASVSSAQAQTARELDEPQFLDLVDRMDQEGWVLITAAGAKAVDAEARRRKLSMPALGYWSPEGLCFVHPPQGDCNGMFRP